MSYEDELDHVITIDIWVSKNGTPSAGSSLRDDLPIHLRDKVNEAVEILMSAIAQEYTP